MSAWQIALLTYLGIGCVYAGWSWEKVDVRERRAIVTEVFTRDFGARKAEVLLLAMGLFTVVVWPAAWYVQTHSPRTPKGPGGDR